MAMTRVWNITDDVNPAVKPQNLVVLGSFLKPGRFVAVDEAHLVRAHKVHMAVKAGLLYIGKKPPSTYAMMKSPPRAKLADGVKTHAPNLKAPVPEVKSDQVTAADMAKLVDGSHADGLATHAKEPKPEDPKEEKPGLLGKKKRK